MRIRILLLTGVAFGSLAVVSPEPGVAQGRQPPIIREKDFSNTAYLFLEDVAQTLGGHLRWNPVSQRVDLAIPSHGLQFLLGSEKVMVDGEAVILENPVVKDDQGVWVPRSFFSSGPLSAAFRKRIELGPVQTAETEKPRIGESAKPPGAEVTAPPASPALRVATPSAPEEKPAPHAIRRIVIDPGHGGKDPGAEGARGTMEKDVNMWMANELADVLREKDFEVLLTRTDDSFIPLASRAALANRHKADLFISVHCNASHSSKLNGFEVYFLSEKASDSHADAVARKENASLEFEGKAAPEPVQAVLRSLMKNAQINQAAQLGGIIDRNVARQLSQTDLGVKQAAFYVLRGAQMPAVLIELGFLSHSGEEQKLNDRAYRDRLVQAITESILEYDRRQRKGSLN